LTQKNQKIDEFNMGIVKESLKQDCVPLLYGEMVFDKKLGMTICSGDTLAPYLAEKLKAEKIFFASDVEGIFTENPYLNKKARLIEKISFGGIGKGANLSESHNIDVTGGLLGKINKLGSLQNMSVKAVEIFNGLQSKNFEKALVGETFSHTTIKM
jgi:isopentenyl phosphate kinase